MTFDRRQASFLTDRRRSLRIVYAVHGYGRGHATRSLAVLAELSRQHEVLVLAGGDAYATMASSYPVVRIPTLGFAYGQSSGVRSNWATLWHNAGAVLDLWCRGALLEMVSAVIDEFTPDVVISDAEIWSHQIAERMGIPRISFDHIGIMAHCRPAIAAGDRIEAAFDAWMYRTLMGQADRVLVSSFYPAPPRSPSVRVVPTLARPEVRAAIPTDGEHLLVYLNRGQLQFDERLQRTLAELDLPVHIYGTPRTGIEGKLHFLPPGNQSFVDDLAACRAVISTAGNQLVGEAMHLGKPILVMPENCVEQRMNARAVEHMGLGLRVAQRALTPELLRQFLARRDEFARQMLAQRRDGLGEALAAIQQFLDELAPGKPQPSARQPRRKAALPLPGRRAVLP